MIVKLYPEQRITTCTSCPCFHTYYCLKSTLPEPKLIETLTIPRWCPLKDAI